MLWIQWNNLLYCTVGGIMPREKTALFNIDTYFLSNVLSLMLVGEHRVCCLRGLTCLYYCSWCLLLPVLNRSVSMPFPMTYIYSLRMTNVGEPDTRVYWQLLVTIEIEMRLRANYQPGCAHSFFSSEPSFLCRKNCKFNAI